MAEPNKRKQKRIVLTIKDKLTICETVRKGQSMTSVAQRFNVGKSTVHDIVKNEAKNLDKARLPAHYYAQRNSWMDLKMF